MNSCESLQGTISKVQIRAGNRNKTFLRRTLNDSSQLMCLSTPIPRDKSNCTAHLGLGFIGQPSPRVRENGRGIHCNDLSNTNLRGLLFLGGKKGGSRTSPGRKATAPPNSRFLPVPDLSSQALPVTFIRETKLNTKIRKQ